jgi:hypothetical protein
VAGVRNRAAPHPRRAAGCGGAWPARLPRMADIGVFWATACERVLWPAGTFARAYTANRRAAIESVIEADPVAICVRAMMVDRTMWSGSASDLLRFCAECARDDIARGGSWVAKNPRALAGRLRRAQTFLRTLGIEITFSREGRLGTRMIRVSTNAENCVSTVSNVGISTLMALAAISLALLGPQNEQSMLTVLTQILNPPGIGIGFARERQQRPAAAAAADSGFV